MKAIDPDIFAKLMSLPDGMRMDLLEFLGATPVGEGQVAKIISEIERSIRQKRHGHSAEAC